MVQAWYVLAFAASATVAQLPFPVQFARSLNGRSVTICLNGHMERTFAGKMGFLDANHAWSSVCADPGSPVSAGQFFLVKAMSSAKVGGNTAAAGNIVAHCFRGAQTPDECAGLQLAVWKTIVDGPNMPNFGSGNLQVMQASPAVMMYAQQDYQTANQTRDAVFLWAGAGPGNGQSQLSETSATL